MNDVVGTISAAIKEECVDVSWFYDREENCSDFSYSLYSVVWFILIEKISIFYKKIGM